MIVKPGIPTICDGSGARFGMFVHFGIYQSWDAVSGSYKEKSHSPNTESWLILSIPVV